MFANTLRFAALAAAVASLAACGGGDAPPPDDAPPAPPSAPPPVTVTIGGTISGLSGSVTLQDNGADNLVMNAAGTFVFATPVNSGANYSVSVATQPANQNCTVSNGAGTAAASNVTNVSVSCSTTQASGSGSLDTTFGSNGKVTTDFSGATTTSKLGARS